MMKRLSATSRENKHYLHQQYAYLRQSVRHSLVQSTFHVVLQISDNIVRVNGTAFTVVCAEENSEKEDVFSIFMCQVC